MLDNDFKLELKGCEEGECEGKGHGCDDWEKLPEAKVFGPGLDYTKWNIVLHLEEYLYPQDLTHLNGVNLAVEILYWTRKSAAGISNIRVFILALI